MSETLLIRETLNSKDIDRLMAGEKILEPGEVEKYHERVQKEKEQYFANQLEKDGPVISNDEELDAAVTSGEA